MYPSFVDGQTVSVEPQIMSEGLELYGGVHTVTNPETVVTVENKNVW